MLAAYFKDLSSNILNINRAHVKCCSKPWGIGQLIQTKEMN